MSKYPYQYPFVKYAINKATIQLIILLSGYFVVCIVPSLATERIESVKAGIIAAGAFVVSELLIMLAQAIIFDSTQEMGNWEWWLPIPVGALTGLLFGVTYRYIVRGDRNSHLNDGAVLAFGLVRGLALVEGQDLLSSLWLLVMLVTQSIICFAFARLILDIAIARRWMKPFM